MTLQEFITWLGDHPYYVLGFFLLMPLTALISSVLGKGEGHLSPWSYLYSALVFLACIPGIFSVTLSVYLFLFQRGNIMNTDLYTQVVPIFSMIFTLTLIRRNVSFEDVPGFDKISSLMMMIATIIVVMWLLDRTHIIAFSYIRIQYLLFAVVGLLLLFRLGLRRMMS